MQTLKDFINEMQIENLTVDNINRYLKLYGLKPIQFLNDGVNFGVNFDKKAKKALDGVNQKVLFH